MSIDPIEEAREHAASSKLGFPLLSDPTGTMIKSYGVWNSEAEMALPSVIVVDDRKRIRWQRVGEAIDDRPEEDEVVRAVDEVTREAR